MSQRMKILIAGATGTLGMPLVRALVAKNYQVVGLTRFPEKRAKLEQAGASAVIANALDSHSLDLALQSATPDCVVDLLTAIPKNGPTSASHMQATNELRVRGTENLLRASIAVGVKRIVGESMTFVYGFGDHGAAAKTESDPLRTEEAKPWLQEIVAALRSLEDQFFKASQQGTIEAIPLRYGLFYGANSPSTEYMLRMIKRGFMPVFPGANGITSWIHASDAVKGTIAAIECGHSGEAYNIVDDDPVNINDWIRYAAKLMGARKPFSIPLWLLRWVMPYVAAFSSTRLIVSNQKAKHDLDWQPQYSSYKDGLPQVIAEVW